MNRWVRIAIFPLLGLAAYGLLQYLQWQLKLGDYAQSPQRLALERHERKVVAGGRAGVELLETRYGKTKVMLRCLEKGKAIQRELSLAKGETVEGNCDIELRLLEVEGEDGVRAEFEVSWK
jgi:hypothetical protein